MYLSICKALQYGSHRIIPPLEKNIWNKLLDFSWFWFYFLQVSSVIIPLGFASVYKTYQAVPDELCQIIGYLTVTATITSLGNLMMVAVNRWFFLDTLGKGSPSTLSNTYSWLTDIFFSFCHLSTDENRSWYPSNSPTDIKNSSLFQVRLRFTSEQLRQAFQQKQVCFDGNHDLGVGCVMHPTYKTRVE